MLTVLQTVEQNSNRIGVEIHGEGYHYAHTLGHYRVHHFETTRWRLSIDDHCYTTIIPISDNIKGMVVGYLWDRGESIPNNHITVKWVADPQEDHEPYMVNGPEICARLNTVWCHINLVVGAGDRVPLFQHHDVVTAYKSL